MGKLIFPIFLGLLVFTLVNAAQALNLPRFLQPTRPLPSSAFEANSDPQELTLLNSGIGSFEKRLQIIEAAQKSIDVEFYIYKTDLAGRLFTQALIKKAKQGVKVRVLVDSAPFVRSLNQYYAAALGKYGIQVRFYNESFMLDLQRVNHRSHRKTLIIDSEQAITGGRNVADEYFDLSETYNFVDRDVYVQGTLVLAIQKSFDDFWNTKISQEFQKVLKPEIQDYGFNSEKDARQSQHISELDRQAYRRYRQELGAFVKGMNQAESFISPTKEDLGALLEIHRWGQEQLALSPTGTCNQTYFIADMPGWKKGARVMYDQLANFIRQAESRILIQTPYFVTTSNQNLFNEALLKNVKLEIMTNSLFATDNLATVAVFNARIEEMMKLGAKAWVYDGQMPSDVKMSRAQKSRWGIHAKSAVLDDDTIMISTFNIDPRSKDLNAEMALICRGNKQLASALRSDMQRMQEHLVKLGPDGQPEDGRGLYFDAPAGKKFWYLVVSPLAQLFDFWL